MKQKASSSKSLPKPVAALARAIGEQLLRRRIELKLSQADMEKRTKINRANIRKYEKGRVNATLGILLDLATALDADVVVSIEPRAAKPAK